MVTGRTTAYRSVRIGVVCLLLSTVTAGRALAADQSADLEQKATTAFALGRYAEAANDFERAYEASPQPALLYNTAQAYRLAGNKERALTLYQNYLRVYGSREKRAEVESWIAQLTTAIERDRVAATKPRDEMEHAAAAPAPVVPPVAQAPSEPAPPALVAKPSEGAPESRPLVSRPWFWATIGGAVVAGVIVAVLVASGGAKDPMPSLGTAKGN
jgi:hypothetical protein